MNELESRLRKFASEASIRGKGPLSVMLVLTRRARRMQPPYADEDFLTAKRGQVAGLSRGAVQRILADHGISRVLAQEAGRTSRGSINRMQSYVKFLNGLDKDGLLDFDAIERWWVDRVREFFASEPLKLKVDASRSIRSIVAELIKTALERQRECQGAMILGAVLQHLVGAKLELALPDMEIQHNGFAVADQAHDRKGDFLVGDTVIHVTAAPSEALIEKCQINLNGDLRPLIITTADGAGGAVALAKNKSVGDRIEILEIEQFLATNVLEWSGFQQKGRSSSVEELVDRYNRIVEECETDPSLRIEIG